MVAPNIEVSNDFFHDACDYLHRYRLTEEHFYAVKSKRLKLFLDLRMAAECIMKAHASYFRMAGLSRQEIVRKVESFRHNLSALAGYLDVGECAEGWPKLKPFIEKLNQLPVDLRYRLDGSDFRMVEEVLYYETIGCDPWMKGLENVLLEMRNALNETLVKHSGFVSVEDLRALFEGEPSYNKYANKKK
jgi:hypothetical protein